MIDRAVIAPDTRDGHQPPHPLAIERVAGKRLFGAPDLAVQGIV